MSGMFRDGRSPRIPAVVCRRVGQHDDMPTVHRERTRHNVKRYFPMHEGAQLKGPDMVTPFEHSLGCNLVVRRMEDPPVCTCEAVAIAKGLADIDAGRVVPRRRRDVPSWLEGSVVESFSKEQTLVSSVDYDTIHFSYCPAGKDETRQCTCHESGHHPGCIHLIDPYMYCNCDFLPDYPLKGSDNTRGTLTVDLDILSEKNYHLLLALVNVLVND